MRIALICFTGDGQRLGEAITSHLAELGHSSTLSRGGKEDISLAAWTASAFQNADALLYIGAAGIAVRAIAPLVRFKTADPAVLCVDDQGRFVIPLLSGHVGGANKLANALAPRLHAVPVITTATDGKGLFAVDSWAVSQELVIANPQRIKAVSAALLRGEAVGLHGDFPIADPLPKGIRLDETHPLIRVSIRSEDNDALLLIPPIVTAGIGCRRGAPLEAIEAAVEAILRRHHIHPSSLAAVHSLDRKADEAGLLAFCEKHSLPFHTFSAEVLAAVEGDFPESAFVRKTVDVGNVCARSAVMGGGRLIAGRFVQDGVTVALAQRDYTVTFGEYANVNC